MKQMPSIIYDFLPGFILPKGFLSNQNDQAGCIYLASCSENAFRYMDPSFSHITGYGDGIIYEKGIDWWFTLIHPDDINPMLSKILQHCFLLPVKKRLNKPFSLEYRLKHAGGKWIWIRETKCVVYITEEGKNEFILGRLEGISEIKREEEERMSTVIREDGNSNPLLKAAIPILNADREKDPGILSISNQFKQPEGVVMPTKREKEILQLIGEGYSTKLIADKLHISINTVETHRRHLLEKIRVKNSMELIKQTSGAFWSTAI